MKISIITVVYNNEKTIQDAMHSVFSQTYKNIEYIIIDGGSKDKTVELINNYNNQLGYFVSEKDKGLYDAMNKGIRAATGEIIGILNSDDLYEDNTVIEDVMSFFNADADLDILYGDLVYVKSDNVQKVVRNWKSKKYYNNFFENGNVPPHPSLFVRSSVYKSTGLFDLDFKLAADYELMLRMFKKNNFKAKYFNRLIVKMRLGGATNQSISNIINQNKEILRAWKKNSLKAPYKLMPLRVIKRLFQFV
ncbi:glycosyltransferase family 2 protein [Flavobacterium sp. KACC 22761]|uniref:glycosyltransferase family 2 protein n=1 Tax=Flavobacterium sp. KACC 22761 TaxID=3092665 RepID=UPI002A74B5E2|nr:glycosyltransferase family 2 protein [Flavobacterium sp. KACC 22761]WPO79518.1 glycosyltransferase family 2 protein [Flavobacterium sp. KACC 22761]